MHSIHCHTAFLQRNHAAVQESVTKELQFTTHKAVCYDCVCGQNSIKHIDKHKLAVMRINIIKGGIMMYSKLTAVSTQPEENNHTLASNH